jgi:hypothetical protein
MGLGAAVVYIATIYADRPGYDPAWTSNQR